MSLEHNSLPLGISYFVQWEPIKSKPYKLPGIVSWCEKRDKSISASKSKENLDNYSLTDQNAGKISDLFQFGTYVDS
jgi:hypothetical protein